MHAFVIAAFLAAHFEPQVGRQPFFVDGQVAGGDTTWGVVLPNGDRFGRVCEFAFSDEVTGQSLFFSRRRLDGSVLVGTIDGLKITTDAGCTSTPIDGVLGSRLTFAVAEANDTLFAVTGDFQSQNGIWRSADEGTTWSEALASIDGLLLFQIVASADGQRLAASGTFTQPESVPALFVSDNAGQTWVDVSSAYADVFVVRALTFDVDDEGLLLSILGQEDAEIRVAGPTNYAQSVVLGKLLSGQPERGVEAKSGAVFLGARYFVSTNAGKTWRQRPGEAFEELTDAQTGPTDCLVVSPDGASLIGCGKDAGGSLGLFLETTDGENWSTLVGFDDVDYRICPEGTPGFANCAVYIESNCGDVDDNDLDGLTNCDDPDCDGRAPCGGAGEGEGEEGEGEGEGEDVVNPRGPSCLCTNANGFVWLGVLALFLAARRRGRAPAL
jgi:photosystem II stability/assembly factor-like uncharacterized protein